MSFFPFSSSFFSLIPLVHHLCRHFSVSLFVPLIVLCPRLSFFSFFCSLRFLSIIPLSSLPLFSPWLFSYSSNFLSLVLPVFLSSCPHSYLPTSYTFSKLPAFLNFFAVFNLGAPVFPLFTLRYHPVPPAAGPCHSSDAGCLGYNVSGQETGRGNLSYKPCPLCGVRDSLIGFCYDSNSASRMANLGTYWLKPASHPLPSVTIYGL